ncbi:MAG: hypothetical protein A2W42_06005 [Candidatus Muproteobacteria bacterium RIFCSPHIGHO2_01_60_12]|nr:MAG: hypothetical protein A2W42_06005 [Candidatus Muproteobacteria bacterium RIFCSPHIGHO2_01_60_12]
MGSTVNKCWGVHTSPNEEFRHALGYGAAGKAVRRTLLARQIKTGPCGPIFVIPACLGPDLSSAVIQARPEARAAQ